MGSGWNVFLYKKTGYISTQTGKNAESSEERNETKWRDWERYSGSDKGAESGNVTKCNEVESSWQTGNATRELLTIDRRETAKNLATKGKRPEAPKDNSDRTKV